MTLVRESDGRFAGPEETFDSGLLDRVAVAWTPGGRDMHEDFLSACKADAEAHAGIVSVNRVRAMCESLNIPPRKWSSLWTHYTGPGRPMRRAGRWEEVRGDGSRNNGKPVPLRRWVG